MNHYEEIQRRINNQPKLTEAEFDSLTPAQQTARANSIYDGLHRPGFKSMAELLCEDLGSPAIIVALGAAQALKKDAKSQVK